MTVLSLQKSIIYGPVRSRRLGASLGVNLSPVSDKLCSYNCVYCQYGWTSRHEAGGKTPGDLPPASEVEAAVDGALRRGHPPDYITFAGNGEPTLHPEFGDIVDRVRASRDRNMPAARVAVLSNSSTVGRRDIREALGRLDDPIMKLDTGTEEGWRRFNRPCPGIDWKDLVAGLEALEGPILQSLFAHGKHGNTHREEIEEWVGLVKRIQPRTVQVYTLDRPTPDRDLEPVEEWQLEEIRDLVRPYVSGT
jgi:wyosine [tRNA(Phe)-imidazoG37] synthetase (radical SAM superfamily)